MAVRIKPETTTEACFPDELIFWRTLNKVDEAAVGVVPLPQHFGEPQIPPPLRHQGVEGVDSSISDGIARWRSAPKDERQMRQRLLLPPGHMRDNVSD